MQQNLKKHICIMVQMMSILFRITDMDFKTARPTIDAMKERAEQKIFGYTSRPDKYFQCIANWQKKRYNCDMDINFMAFAPEIVPALRSDEIHFDLTLNRYKHTAMASVSLDIAAITTIFIILSKTLNLAGLQSPAIIFNNEKKGYLHK